jgi:hypothetical protein
VKQLKNALALAAKGCYVFPVREKDETELNRKTGKQELFTTKRPRIFKWQIFATTRQKTIRGWWTKWPNANVGIHAKGLIAIDVDGPSDHQALLKLRESHDFPDTVVNHSGNPEPHHYHLIYRLPEGMKAFKNGKICNNQTFLAKHPFLAGTKIEIKSKGGYIVGPGSLHKSGKPYRFDRPVANLYQDATLAPQWLLDHFCAPDLDAEHFEVGSDSDLLNRIIKTYYVDRVGVRHGLMTKAVAKLAGMGLDRGRILKLINSYLTIQQENYSTPLQEALQEAVNCVEATMNKRDRGELYQPPDHMLLASQQKLLPTAARWLADFTKRISPSDISMRAPGRQTINKLFMVCPPEGFLRTLLLLVQYRFRKDPDETTAALSKNHVLLTRRQIEAAYKHVTGKSLCITTYYRFANLFISTPERKAGLQSLLRLEEKSDRIGVPSRYVITGLLPAFRKQLLPNYKPKRQRRAVLGR